jgi:hypothetical protein
MRLQREEPLNERTPPQHQRAAHQSQERIKKESELMRIQRENFLNGFNNSPPKETYE